MELTGFIENAEIVKLPDGVDHETWLEIGEQEEEGLKCVLVDAYTKEFGWLYSHGWITKEELEKAKKGLSFHWKKSCISGHMHP